jgi:predicted TIM-barrel fold metal-dependent hydrolase
VIKPFIIDAHVHLGRAGQLVTPDATVAALLADMDRFAIRYAIASDHAALLAGGSTGLASLSEAFEQSAGRIRGLLVFDPRDSAACLDELEQALGWTGLAGIKIHPAFHCTPAEDEAYRPAWDFAGRHGLAILAHSWSVSDHNPAQAWPCRTDSSVGSASIRWPGWSSVMPAAAEMDDHRRSALPMPMRTCTWTSPAISTATG